ncbi:hypothetical protein FACS189443_4910 [Planctomycetales bacterium]|nr:hypothetical protein FACS189443_4910 [Planctomycetales bacterium]
MKSPVLFSVAQFFAVNFSVAALIFAAVCVCKADSAECEPCEPAACDPCGSVFSKNNKLGIDFYGWAMTGITVNNHGGKNEYGGNSAYGYNNNPNRGAMTDGGGNTSILMLEQPSDWKLNQLWVGAKKDLTEKLGVGFRGDFAYGTDMRYSRNWGDRSFDSSWCSGDYYFSAVQLYGLVGTKKLNVQVGKFAGGFAYEGLAAPKEFFYSHANICYGRPLVTEGAMVHWNPNEKWSFSGGWTAGVFNSLENPYDDNGFLGKTTYHFNKKADITYKIYYNDKGYRSATNVAGIDCYNTLIFTYKLSDKWFAMLEAAVVDSKTYNAAGKVGGDAWGFNSHLIYTVNDKLSIGLRSEFHHSHNSSFDMPGVTGGQGGDLYEFTLAANYKITDKIRFRPELRFDQADYDNGFLPFGGHYQNGINGVGGGDSSSQLSGGCSFVIVF